MFDRVIKAADALDQAFAAAGAALAEYEDAVAEVSRQVRQRKHPPHHCPRILEEPRNMAAFAAAGTELSRLLSHRGEPLSLGALARKAAEQSR